MALAQAHAINAEHAQAEAAFREGLIHAVRAGELLLQAKSHLAHGEWLRWLNTNVGFSVRTARAYMRVASNWGMLDEVNAQPTAHWTLDDALTLLSGRSKDTLAPLPPGAEEEPPQPDDGPFDWPAEMKRAYDWLLRHRERFPGKLWRGYTNLIRRVLNRIDLEDPAP